MAHMTNLDDATAKAILDSQDELAVSAAILDGAHEPTTGFERAAGIEFLMQNPLTAMLYGSKPSQERELSVA